MKYILTTTLLFFFIVSYGQKMISGPGELLCATYNFSFVDSFLYFQDKAALEKYLVEKNQAHKNTCMYDSTWNDSLSDLVIVRCLIADCHGRCNLTAGWDEKQEYYLIEPVSVYGGCRAGGRSRIIWMLIPKLADEKQIVFRHVWLDRIHEE